MGKEYCVCVVRIGTQTGAERVAWQLFIPAQPVPTVPLAKCYIIYVTKIFFLKMLRGLEPVLIGPEVMGQGSQTKGISAPQAILEGRLRQFLFPYSPPWE